MAVNLSPVGGVAAQFFTNNAVPLSGGKLYTYAAGTTTPQVAYTTSQGNIAWTNPIVLDAGGRVPGSGEVWLTDGLIYKFVLKDANDVLIATYDNITGINSNAVAYTNSQEIQTATAGQTVFTLTTMQYQVGTNSLSVFVDGVNQYGPGAQYAYTETSSTVVTFVSGLHVGAEVKFTTTQQQSAGAVDASQVSYTPPFTGSVTTNVEAKLEQYISVLDFGADPTGAIDSTNAIQAALDYAGSIDGTCVYMPQGDYLISSTLTFESHSTKLYGANRGYIPGTYATNVGGTRLTYTGANYAISFNGQQYCEVADLTIQSTTANGGIYIGDIAHFFRVSRVVIDGQLSGTATGFTSAGIAIERSYYGTIEGCDIAYCAANGIYGFRECNGNFFQMNSIRQCGTGIRITDTTSNSDGCSIISNEIESARTDVGSSYAIALIGADSNMVIGNRIEWTSNGHVFINSGVGVAQYNQIIGNVCEGTAPAIIIGDGVGSNQVVGTFISGGRAATAVTINSDCIYTRMEAAPDAYGGALTDNGYGSIVHIDPSSANKWYEKNFASNAINHNLVVGGSAVIDDYKANYHRIDFTNLADAFQHRALDAGGTWLAIFQMGTYRLWVNPGDGKLYINAADPTAPNDGTVVGTQT